MNFEGIKNWTPRKTWKYALNIELENLMLFGNPECSLNETVRLHLMNTRLDMTIEE